MGAQRNSGFEDGFLELVEEQLRRCRRELVELDESIARLQEDRVEEAKRVAQLEDLLRGNRPPDADGGAEPSLVPPQRLRGPIADADAVVALIRDNSGPMHYLDIHETLVRRGFEIGGEGKADTLLSRYFNDPRLTRVSRGTYELADRSNGESKPDGKPSPPFSRLAPFKLPSPPTQRLKLQMTVAEMAAAALRKAGKPLHYTEITERILESGWQTRGKTPEASVNTGMVVDIRDNGDNSVFVRTGRGIYGLREWIENAS